MKTKVIAMLAAGLCSLQGVSETFTVPYGQWSHQPWEAKYFFAPNDTETPPADTWATPSFDDSAWATIQGPIENDYSDRYIVSPWGDLYSTYWLRRTFESKGFNEEHNYVLRIQHDDGATVYLNGTEIYSNSRYTHYAEKDVTELVKDLLVDGKNVLAVKTSDTGGGDAYIDFGLYDYSAKQPLNQQFDNYTSNWTNNGYYTTHSSYAQKCIELGQGRDHNWSQTLSDMKEGLYVVRAQAFERNGSADEAWNAYADDSITSTLFINSKSVALRNVFDEAQVENIYQNRSVYRTTDGTFIPTDGYAYCLALNAGLYENTLYAYVSDGTVKLGVDVKARNNRSVVIDNFRLEYISEAELNDLITKSALLLAAKIYAPLKDQVSAVITQVKAAADYRAKSEVLTTYSRLLNDVELSYQAYKKLADEIAALEASLQDNPNISPSVLALANAHLATLKEALANCSWDNRAIARGIVEARSLKRRAGFKHLDITVDVPGSMGDSILAKTENFVDVYSMTVRGTFNANDWNLLASLGNLRELDMAGVQTDVIPEKRFQDNRIIERIILPQTVQWINRYSFYECRRLVEVVWPSSLKIIGEYAFYHSGIKEVILPESTTGLREYSFYDCDALQYVKLPASITSIPSTCFDDCNNLTKVDFNEGLNSIGSSAFYNCNIQELEFPSTLLTIKGGAFERNSQLKSITFNEGLYQIEDNAFRYCDALTEVNLPSTLVRADASPFDYCDNLRTVTCLSIEPPVMNDQIPYGCSMSDRTLYVPQLSINTYKQHPNWMKFPTILPINTLPDAITILGEVRLTLPDTIPADYKPSLSLIHDRVNDWQYGRLSVNGPGTLSLSDFTAVWDQDEEYSNSNKVNFCALVNNSHLRADNVSVTIMPEDRMWNFISFPFDVKISDIENVYEGQNWVIRSYSGERRAEGETGSTWLRMSDDATLKAGQGYIIQSSRYEGGYERDYSRLLVHAVDNANKNRIFTTEDVTTDLGAYPSEFAHNRGWNLIGNPYPSFYDIRFMNFTAPITVRNMRNNNYRAYSPIDDSYILTPGQAFFVQCPAGVSGVTFSKEGRQINKEVRSIEAPARSAAAAGAERAVVDVEISFGELTDVTRVVVNEQASAAYELERDAAKMMEQDANPLMIYTSAGAANYAINERPLADGIVELSINFPADGSYSLTLARASEAYDVELIDRLTGTTADLTADSSYELNAAAGLSAGRFALRLTRANPLGIDGIGADASRQEPDAIYTITGIRVSEPLAPGFYIKNGEKIYVK